MSDLKISTKRLLIRNLHIDDVANFHIYRSNKEVVKYQGFDIFTKKQATVFIQLQQNKNLEIAVNGYNMA